ncbi:MAG TPA: hypothetical protein VKZ67_12175 [Natronosporangium sp.]|nr:hypothetical protein [Natronosporangium sp.]
MDLWELTKLVFRRWLVSLPMLLALAGGLVLMQVKMSPDYEAVAHVQLIPPQVQPATDNQDGGGNNPWAQLGADSLGQAVVVSMQRPSLAATLEEEGLSDKFTVALDPYFPIVNIEVIGETPEQATATAQRLAQMVVDDVQARQDAYNVPSEKAISTLLLDDGSDLTPNNSSKRRAMVAVAGLGLLLTGATSVAVDALIYRYRRRRSGRPGQEPWPARYEPAATPVDAPTSGAGVTNAPVAGVAPVSPAPPARPPVGVDLSHQLTRDPSSVPAAGRFPTASPAAERGGQDGRDWSDDRHSPSATPLAESRPADYPAPTPPPYPDDSTVVLPLAHGRWPDQDSGSKR